MEEFYIVRKQSLFCEWVNNEGNWEVEECDDPLAFGFHTDYPTLEEALADMKAVGGEVLVFSSEKPYKLLKRI